MFETLNPINLLFYSNFFELCYRVSVQIKHVFRQKQRMTWLLRFLWRIVLESQLKISRFCKLMMFSHVVSVFLFQWKESEFGRASHILHAYHRPRFRCSLWKIFWDKQVLWRKFVRKKTQVVKFFLLSPLFFPS